MSGFNHHHELFIRREFERQRFARELRERPELIVSMEIETHQELHEDCSPVPVFRDEEAKEILNLMDWRGNYLDNIEQLIATIEKVVHNRIGQAAICALEAQISFIKDGAWSLDMNNQPPVKHNRK